MKQAGDPQPHFSDWRQRNESFFTVLEVERNMMFIILSLIVLVAAFNIISGLMMLVKDKGRDIGILRTMGASKGAIMRVFLITGASIGVVGTLAGAVLGIVFCWKIDEIRQFVAWLTNTTLFDPEIYYLTRLPADINCADHGGHRRSWRWSCRCSPRSIRPGAPRASIPSKRCATSEATGLAGRHRTAPCCSCADAARAPSIRATARSPC